MPARSPSTTLEAFVETLDARVRDADGPLDATIRPPERDAAATPLASGGTALRMGAVLGQGGMGVVRLAEQQALQREVAVKTVREELKDDAGAVARLIREARVTGLVEHPNVVPLHALERGPDGAPQMIMKRIEGVPWRALIQDPAHPEMPRDAADPLVWHLEVLMRVCDAVHYAHSRGILHLDVKPDNVMIGRFREVYLVDWGIAVSTRERHRGTIPLASELCELLGTPAYMPPELVQPGERAPDERTDVYLLAATLYEIVAGRPPHAGDSIVQVLYAALVSEPEPPESVPAELAAIVRRGLARDPEERFESAEGLRAALADFLAHRSSARLAEGAMAQLDAIAPLLALPGQTGAELARRLTECLFGFRAALREWPQNELARRGLADAILGMARHHLEAGETSAAHTLLAEAADLPADRWVELEDLRARASEESKRSRALRDLGLEQDLSPAIGKRAVGIVSLVVVLNAVGTYVWYTARAQWREVEWNVVLTASAALAIIGGLATAYWRRHDTTAATRRLSFVLVVVLVALFVERVGWWLLEAPLERVLVGDTFLLGLSAAICGVLIDRRAWACAAFTFAGWAAMIALPAYAIAFMVAGTTLGVVAMACLWLRGVPP